MLPLKAYFLIFSILVCVCRLQAQKRQSFSDTVQHFSQLWDKAFNQRDTTVYFSYVDTSFSITAGGGTSTGLQRFKFVTNRLYSNRPDIAMYFNVQRAEANDKHDIGYDTGNWIEAWTEKGDTAKSELKGKYWRMWRRRNDDWFIMAIVLTPLSCKGSYCNK